MVLINDKSKSFLEAFFFTDKCIFNLGKENSHRETSRIKRVDGAKDEPFLWNLDRTMQFTIAALQHRGLDRECNYTIM